MAVRPSKVMEADMRFASGLSSPLARPQRPTRHPLVQPGRAYY